MCSKILNVPKCSDAGLKWDEALTETDFISPWPHPNQVPPPITCFKALYDDKWLYFQFTAFYSNKLTIYIRNNHELEVAQSDRIELFFARDLSLDAYYCLEIDPSGRILDYQARFHRWFNYDWEWNRKALKVCTEIKNDRYIVEGAISLKYLESLHILSGKTFYIGLFRANCLLSEENSDIQWISWVNPETETADFHIPACFGKCCIT